MDAKIETYRGFDIMFDTNRERFFVEHGDDEIKEKSSYAAAKNYIDEYIKNNQEFVPFQAVRIGSYDTGEVIDVIGIRKDGAFVYNEKGKSVQLSKYNEKEYVIYDAATHAPIIKQLKELEEKSEKAARLVIAKREELKGAPIETLKTNYTL